MQLMYRTTTFKPIDDTSRHKGEEEGTSRNDREEEKDTSREQGGGCARLHKCRTCGRGGWEMQR